MISRTGIQINIICLLLTFSCKGLFAAEISTCPEIPFSSESGLGGTGTSMTWRGFEEPETIFEWMGGKELAPLGQGYLKVLDIDEYRYDWPKHALIPLWGSVSGEFFGWFRDGHLVPDDQSPPVGLSGAGLVETSYQHFNLVVLKVRDGGWLLIQLNPGKEGAKWTHLCHLGLGKAKLVYQSWNQMFSETDYQLQVRTGNITSLFREPLEDSGRIASIDQASELKLILIKDDWMLVEYDASHNICEDGLSTGLEEANPGNRQRGWLKWEDHFLGPLIWFASAKCGSSQVTQTRNRG